MLTRNEVSAALSGVLMPMGSKLARDEIEYIKQCEPHVYDWVVYLRKHLVFDDCSSMDTFEIMAEIMLVLMSTMKKKDTSIKTSKN